MKKIILIQFYILLLGSVFAWSNFGYELYRWLNQEPCNLGCSANTAGGLTNPFITPCFYGAIFFTASFGLSVLIVKGFKKSSPEKIIAN